MTRGFDRQAPVLVTAMVCILGIAGGASSWADTIVPPAVVLKDPQVEDQDDMCIWLHPGDPAKSTVIASDKAAGKLFVYDLTGKTLQVVSIDGKPGNIDLRYGFPFGGGKVDIVALNERDHSSILVYQIDPNTRELARIDDGAIKTGPNYGFALYRSAKSGKFHGFTVAEEEGDGAEQYELFDNGSGRVTGAKVRAWDLGHSEGCVADDETGHLYIAEEERGIWKVGAEPEDPTPGELIIPLGPHDFEADAEGVTICYGRDGAGYLIASSQGNGQFKVFRREAPA